MTKEGANPLNNTGFIGAIKLIEESHAETVMECTIGTEAGDPKGYGNVLIEFTRQELEFRKGLLSEAKNEQKSTSKYIAYNTISPIWGAEYIIKSNPLLSEDFGKKYFRIQNYSGEIFMLSAIAASFFVDNDSRQSLVAAGISVGVIWRLFGLLGVTDIKDYNSIAKSKYHVNKVFENQ